MNKEFILKLLKSNNKEDRLRGIKVLLDDKENILLSNNTRALENGFTIDNNIVNIQDILYNDIKIYFIGVQVFEELFESSLVLTED